jgi:hypothetical protein
VEIYTDRPPVVRRGEIELPAFLPRHPAQAASKKRCCFSLEVWGTVRARIARHEALAPDSPRRRPTLARLRWLERPEEAA